MSSCVSRLSRFVAVVLAAGLASGGAVLAQPDGAANRIEDIQFGESATAIRIAFICSRECPVEETPDGAFIRSATGAFDIPLEGRSRHLRALSVEPQDGGSRLILDPLTELSLKSIGACDIHGARSVCLDYGVGASLPKERIEASAEDDLMKDETPADDPPPALRDQPGERIATPRRAPPTGPTPILGSAVPVGGPGLRDDLDGLPAPERFQPPVANAPTADGPQGAAPPELRADMTPAEATRPDPADPATSRDPAIAAALSIAERADAIVSAHVDMRREAEAILGRDLNEATCADAANRLQEDAWALDAMVEIGFCKALDGRLEDADDDFSRLLAYAPDHVEALAGRGLIAVERGEAEAARAFLDAAIEASPLPPIADRIAVVRERL